MTRTLRTPANDDQTLANPAVSRSRSATHGELGGEFARSGFPPAPAARVASGRTFPATGAGSPERRCAPAPWLNLSELSSGGPGEDRPVCADYSATSMLRTCVVPDLGDELITALVRLNALLLDLDGADPDRVPPPVTGGAALAAFDGLWNALYPTQRQDGHLIAPDGFSRHQPMSFLGISIVDLDILSATACTLGLLLACEDEIVCDTLSAYTHGGETTADVVADIARIHGLLDLRQTADTRLLQHRLAEVDLGTDVLLSDEENAAYVRTVRRFNQMWSNGSSLLR